MKVCGRVRAIDCLKASFFIFHFSSGAPRTCLTFRVRFSHSKKMSKSDIDMYATIPCILVPPSVDIYIQKMFTEVSKH